jgi:hypothetical protein
MTTQEIWQLQGLEAPRMSAAYIRLRAHDLARGMQIRIGLEYCIGIPGVLFIAWSCWMYFMHRPVMLAGLALTLLAVAYTAFRLRPFASPVPVPEDAGVLDSLSFYRRELERQRDSRRGKWQALPLVVPGLITVFASFVLELNPVPWSLIATKAIVALAVLSLAFGFEERSARRLQREIDALDSLVGKDTAR